MNTAEIITKIGHIKQLQDELTNRLYSNPDITEDDADFLVHISNILDDYTDELESKIKVAED